MASDELRIVLEEVKEKFDTIIGGYNFLSEKVDRVAKEIKEEISELRQDLNDHRSNTELPLTTLSTQLRLPTNTSFTKKWSQFCIRL